MTEAQALEKFFKSVLVDFKRIGGGEGISRSKKVQVLFGDREVRNFVLMKGFDLLKQETDMLERIRDTLERFLLLSGKLKS